MNFAAVFSWPSTCPVNELTSVPVPLSWGTARVMSFSPQRTRCGWGHSGTDLQKIEQILIFLLLPYPGSWIREDIEFFWKRCLLTSDKPAALGVQCVQVLHDFSSSCAACPSKKCLHVGILQLTSVCSLQILWLFCTHSSEGRVKWVKYITDRQLSPRALACTVPLIKIFPTSVSPPGD